jgi:hypothetical protein
VLLARKYECPFSREQTPQIPWLALAFEISNCFSTCLGLTKISVVDRKQVERMFISPRTGLNSRMHQGLNLCLVIKLKPLAKSIHINAQKHSQHFEIFLTSTCTHTWSNGFVANTSKFVDRSFFVSALQSHSLYSMLVFFFQHFMYSHKLGKNTGKSEKLSTYRSYGLGEHQKYVIVATRKSRLRFSGVLSICKNKPEIASSSQWEDIILHLNQLAHAKK